MDQECLKANLQSERGVFAGRRQKVGYWKLVFHHRAGANGERELFGNGQPAGLTVQRIDEGGGSLRYLVVESLNEFDGVCVRDGVRGGEEGLRGVELGCAASEQFDDASSLLRSMEKRTITIPNHMRKLLALPFALHQFLAQRGHLSITITRRFASFCRRTCALRNHGVHCTQARIHSLEDAVHLYQFSLAMHRFSGRGFQLRRHLLIVHDLGANRQPLTSGCM